MVVFLTLPLAAAFLVLLPSAFIVLKWKARPVLSYFIALSLMFCLLLGLILWATNTTEVYQVDEDRFLFSEQVLFAMLPLIVFAPILGFIQWSGRRHYKRDKAIALESFE